MTGAPRAISLWQQVEPGGRATLAHLDVVIEAAIRRVDPEARAVLAGLPTGGRKVRRAIAEYGSPLTARAGRALNLPKSTAQRALRPLAESGLIEEADGGWQVVDPLPARWIRTTYATRP